MRRVIGWGASGVAAAVLMVIFGLPALAETLTASWTLPTTNIDGTPLEDLAGFRLYDLDCGGTLDDSDPSAATCSQPWARTQVADIADAAATSHDFDATTGQHHYGLTAYDTSGNESPLSNIVAIEVTDETPPAVPTLDEVFQ